MPSHSSAPVDVEAPFLTLGDEQRSIADSTATNLLILGGAGVGKTTTALWAARRHLTERGELRRPARGNRVLMVAFSRTAVAQIRSRAGGVREGLGDHLEILTFHGLAYRLVRNFSSLLGFAGPPQLIGEARSKLGEGAGTGVGLQYEQLLPLALNLLHSGGPVANLLQTRWSLIISDEFQDTSHDEWAFLQAISPAARRILLADPNQMIFGGFKPGVTPARLDIARAQPGCEEHVLPSQSHRDPSQVIPTAAEEIRVRQFDGPALADAVSTGRIRVHVGVTENLDSRAELINELILAMRDDHHTTLGIYTKTNLDAAEMSTALLGQGLHHTPIGFGEAFGEALAAHLVLVDYAAGLLTWNDVRKTIATSITASVKSPRAPELALAILHGSAVPAAIQETLDDYEARLPGLDLRTATELAVEIWASLHFTFGQRAWSRASTQFRALVARASSEATEPHERVRALVSGARDASFVELDSGDTGSVQLMNFSQTKGREADGVILSFLSTDFFGRGGEPWEEASRLLYVSMTRARLTIHVLLPDDPHDLVAPLSGLALA